MAEDRTLIYTPDANNNLLGVIAPLLQQRGLDPNVLAMCGNGSFGGNNFLWVLFILLLWNRNGWGNDYGNGGLANQLSNDSGRELLMQAIQGNANAISQLASNFGCSASQIQNVLASLSTQIQSVGAQQGLSAQQIINSIQSGDNQIATQIAQCCCNVTNTINNQGYENRIANLEQTNFLGSKMDSNTQTIKDQIANQTNIINDKFCALEMREMKNKYDAVVAENTRLNTQLVNTQQTAMFGQMIGQATAPIISALSGLQADVNSIKCKQPETVTIPAPQGVLVPSCAAWQMGLYGTTPFNGGGFWG